eukprot:TRINITY_DN6793_c0_g1_i1.p1 TRINITY_DN6793_c0_g1~~TRINITY_DN6793_c0_g1_i1.p1  ORF type:complete len:250 (-),score=46.58 TRINITY_DN6793_c0_g1_i1:45-794(-)
MYGKTLVTPVPWIAQFSRRDFCAAILIAFDLGPEHYQLGVSKVFFRPAKASVMNKVIETNGILPEERIEKVKRWRRRKIIKRVKGAVIAFLAFKHRLLSMRTWKMWIEILNPVMGIVKTVMPSLKKARRSVKVKNDLKCALILQSRCRTLVAQREALLIRQDIETKMKMEQKMKEERWRKREEEKRRKREETENRETKQEEERRKEEEDKTKTGRREERKLGRRRERKRGRKKEKEKVTELDVGPTYRT